MCERNCTPSSLTRRRSAREKTWKPPLSVSTGPLPPHEALQTAQAVNDFGSRPQHEVIRVGQHDLRAGFRELSGA